MSASAPYRVLGLMSGTSLDGLDLILVDFESPRELSPSVSHPSGWTYTVHRAETIPYSAEWIDLLRNSHLLSKEKLDQLDHQYGEWLGHQCLHFLNGDKIDLIGSHGHTVHHRPEKGPHGKGISVQIGHGPTLAKITGTPVVCNFRQPDVDLGGQGAPLVPIGDLLLFSNYEACLNMGGFLNASWEENGLRRACDIAPMNIVLNELARRINLPFDSGGKIARSGNFITELFEQWNRLAFYAESPPKSLGREFIDEHYSQDWKDHHIADLMHTFTHHSAYQWAKFSHPFKQVLATGGGVHNDYWIETAVKYGAPSLTVPDGQTIEFKEALIFALLAVLRYRNEVNVLASVTGAQKNHSSGRICLP